MNSNQILCFLEAAKEMNFSKAALNLYISQPNLSRTILALEKELQTQLFVRHPNKTLSLTDSGKIYFDAFDKCVQLIESAKSKCSQAEDAKSTLRLGYVFGWNISDYVMHKIDCFSAEHPYISIELECYHITELIQKMMTEEIDACITFENAVIGAKPLGCRKIYELPKVLIYQSRLLPKDSEKITPDDLKNQTFLYFEPSLKHSMERELMDFFADIKYTPNLKLVPNQETMVSAVENGKGVAIMDRWSQPIYSTKISWLPLNSHHNIVLAWNGGEKNKIILTLYEYLK